ncbi:MAG: hypothetical protein ACJA0Q_000217 [Saprospiraceae bacterium]|jgi:hypothetical protein
MNKGTITIIIASFFCFSSCATKQSSEENYLYHYKIKEKIEEFKNTTFKLCLISNEKKDTIVIMGEDLEKRLNILFDDGLTGRMALEYEKRKYKKEGYKVIELSSNKERHSIKKLFYKEDEGGNFYYLLKSSSKNGLANQHTDISFSSTGEFLIVVKQEVLLSYSSYYRVEGRVLKRIKE